MSLPSTLNQYAFSYQTAWAEEWGTTKQRFDYWENKAIKADLINNYKSGFLKRRIELVRLQSIAGPCHSRVLYAAIAREDTSVFVSNPDVYTVWVSRESYSTL